MKTITLNFTDYYIVGTSEIQLWGGETGFIPMHSFHVTDISDENIFNNLNDAGFGCEHINGAYVDIYENYDGYHKYLTSEVVGTMKEETLDFIWNE